MAQKTDVNAKHATTVNVGMSGDVIRDVVRQELRSCGYAQASPQLLDIGARARQPDTRSGDAGHACRCGGTGEDGCPVINSLTSQGHTVGTAMASAEYRIRRAHSQSCPAGWWGASSKAAASPSFSTLPGHVASALLATALGCAAAHSHMLYGIVAIGVVIGMYFTGKLDNTRVSPLALATGPILYLMLKHGAL